jgi:hypothetical protein
MSLGAAELRAFVEDGVQFAFDLAGVKTSTEGRNAFAVTVKFSCKSHFDPESAKHSRGRTRPAIPGH